MEPFVLCVLGQVKHVAKNYPDRVVEFITVLENAYPGYTGDLVKILIEVGLATDSERELIA